jgi:hypothetical protein
MASATKSWNKKELHHLYFGLIKTAGVDQAITRLHNDIGALEPRIFDGGYDADKFQKLQYLRELARDVYSYKLEQDSKEYYAKK